MTELLHGMSPQGQRAEQPYITSFDDIEKQPLGDVEHIFGAEHPLSVAVEPGLTFSDVAAEYPEMAPDDVDLLLKARLAGLVVPHEVLLTGDDDYMVKGFTELDNHEPERPYLPEQSMKSLKKTIAGCVRNNQAILTAAMTRRPNMQTPMYAMRTISEGPDGVIKAAYGGPDYNAEAFSEPNKDMLHDLALLNGVDIYNRNTQAQAIDLETVAENKVVTKLEITRIPLENGWTIDAVSMQRTPKPEDEQREIYRERHGLPNSDEVNNAIAVERPSTLFTIAACPRGQGFETRYNKDSGKGHADNAARMIEQDMQANATAATQPLRSVVPSQRTASEN